MPITIRNKFKEKLTFINLYYAHLRASSGKRSKKELLLFEMDLETNLSNLYNQLLNGTYKLGKYREFKVYEPKERIIKSLPYRDRIVHQWYIHEFIKPYIIPRFISDTYACIDGRGTHKAILNLQKYMRCMKRKCVNYYILKCDIRKFFYTINKNKMLQIMCEYIKDKKLLELTKVLIFDDDSEEGIPIGNYTSQYFANIYLNKLDQYVKKYLGVKYYVRYMDDFVLLMETKDDAIRLKNLITDFVTSELKLTMNPKTAYYPSKKGVDFCGYRVYETHKLLRTNSKKKIKKKVKLWNKKYRLFVK